MRFTFKVEKYGSRLYHLSWKKMFTRSDIEPIYCSYEADRKARILHAFDGHIKELERAVAEMKAARAKVETALEVLP